MPLLLAPHTSVSGLLLADHDNYLSGAWLARYEVFIEYNLGCNLG